MNNTLATAMHATRCAMSAPIRTTPGALLYGRDMIIDVPLIANLSAIRNCRQQMIDKNLKNKNKKRIEHHYRVGDRVKQIVWNIIQVVLIITWTVVCTCDLLQRQLNYTMNTDGNQYTVNMMVPTVQRIVVKII